MAKHINFYKYNPGWNVAIYALQDAICDLHNGGEVNVNAKVNVQGKSIFSSSLVGNSPTQWVRESFP